VDDRVSATVLGTLQSMPSRPESDDGRGPTRDIMAVATCDQGKGAPSDRMTIDPGVIAGSASATLRAPNS